jgi:integrase
VDRIRYDELADDLRRHYEIAGERDLKEADDRFKPLAKFFTGRRVVDLDGAVINRYIERRQQEGVANGTINRELNVLSRMLRLGYEHQKVLRLPIFHPLKEADPRKGFFEPADFDAVRRQLRPDLQVAVTIAYTYGWRVQSEVLMLALSQVDLQAGTLRLEPGTTKNDDGRVVYLTPELQRVISEQMERVKQLSRRVERVVPHLFPHLTGRLAGERIQDFRKAWETACTKAHVVGMIRHDFRRTAVRNLVNAGVPERVAQTMTGHKTRSVFDRYHIVSPADLKAAVLKLAGTTTGTTPTERLDAHSLTVEYSTQGPVAQLDRAAVS